MGTKKPPSCLGGLPSLRLSRIVWMVLLVRVHHLQWFYLWGSLHEQGCHWTTVWCHISAESSRFGPALASECIGLSFTTSLAFRLLLKLDARSLAETQNLRDFHPLSVFQNRLARFSHSSQENSGLSRSVLEESRRCSRRVETLDVDVKVLFHLLGRKRNLYRLTAVIPLMAKGAMVTAFDWLPPRQ